MGSQRYLLITFISLPYKHLKLQVFGQNLSQFSLAFRIIPLLLFENPTTRFRDFNQIWPLQLIGFSLELTLLFLLLPLQFSFCFVYLFSVLYTGVCNSNKRKQANHKINYNDPLLQLEYVYHIAKGTRVLLQNLSTSGARAVRYPVLKNYRKLNLLFKQD